jgi:hypothetical protein
MKLVEKNKSLILGFPLPQGTKSTRNGFIWFTSALSVRTNSHWQAGSWQMSALVGCHPPTTRVKVAFTSLLHLWNILRELNCHFVLIHPTVISRIDLAVISLMDPTLISLMDPTAISSMDPTISSVMDPTVTSLMDPAVTSLMDLHTVY